MLQLTIASIAIVLAFISGALSIMFAEDEESVLGLRIAGPIFHCSFLVSSTVSLCLYTSRSSFAVGALYTATACILIILQIIFKKRNVCIAASCMAAANAACAAAGYINVHAFLELAISFSVIAILATLIIIMLLFGFDKSFSGVLAAVIPNTAFAAAYMAVCIAGFTVNAKSHGLVKVHTDCSVSVYEYDRENSVIGEATKELNFAEYYALQLIFDWPNVWAYGASSERVEIEVTFPAAISVYISDGTAFEKSNTDDTVWTYKFELNSKLKTLQSGYFIFNYGYGDIKAQSLQFSVSVRAVTDEESADTVLVGYEKSYKYFFNRKNFDFGADNVVKDLSYGDDGYYRITPPVGCSILDIKIRNSAKTWVYYSERIFLSEEYYLLDIPHILQTRVSERDYDTICKMGKPLVVEITAVSIYDYEDTSYEFLYTVENT